jgi:hypothetical protein
MTESAPPLEPDPEPALTPSQRASRLNRIAANTRVITAIWITSAILNVLFLASVVVLGLGYSSNTTQLHRQTAALHNSSVAQCQANNTNRRQDIAIWNLLEKPTRPQSAAQKAKVEKLRQLVKVKDTPRDCVQVFAP